MVLFWMNSLCLKSFLDIFMGFSLECIVEATSSHELKSVTSGYLSDDELPQHSFIALVMQYTASEITTKLKTFGSGVFWTPHEPRKIKNSYFPLY